MAPWPCCAAPTTDVPLVDTNVLLDLFTNDPDLGRLVRTAAPDPVCPGSADRQSRVVYVELAVGYDRVEDLDAALATAGVEPVEIPRAALFLAGRAFQKYRAQRGTRTGVPPDFFIGAHAVVEGISLLTRDARSCRTCFPRITLITPGNA